LGLLLVAWFPIAPVRAQVAPLGTPAVTVGSQYSTTHVYVAEADLDRFVESVIATFGGVAPPKIALTVTPTPSATEWRPVRTPVGGISAFGFTTPIPYAFGTERTGYLVTDLDTAVRVARANGATVVVASFADPVGRDAIVRWPGGVVMQLYWHTTPPSAPPLVSEPENRVYLSSDEADAFIKSFAGFAHATVVSDDPRAPGIEIGRPGETYRRVRLESGFGPVTVLVTDGHLPYPYGREVTGYGVPDLAATLARATAAGVTVLVAPYTAGTRRAAIVQFPGGYIAEIHSDGGR